MPQYMDGHSATVTSDPHVWNGAATLRFLGVPVVRPFRALIGAAMIAPVLGLDLATAAQFLPDPLREIRVPQLLHADFVGPVERGTNGFTVQTLKRNYPDPIDDKLRSFLRGALAGIDARHLFGDHAAALQDDVEAIKQKLIEYAVEVSRWHFLAGRRSFRFFEGATLGYDDGRLVFETAAIERYSRKEFAGATEGVMGGDWAALSPVWLGMVANVARPYAKLPPLSHNRWSFSGWNAPGDVASWHEQVFFPSHVAGDAGDMIGQHPGLYSPG